MNKCDIIVPIYNAYDCLTPCIESIIRNTDLKNNRLILIDDKSPDERVLPLLEKYANNKNIILLKNKQNLGFVGTVNKGMKYSKNDVLLLNSDTEVTPNWLKNIKETAYSEPKVAAVTSLSNNATLVSAPIGLRPNDLPTNMKLDDYARMIEKIAYNETIELPTSHGYCMYIRREAIDDVGYFDEETFGRGYGEENDFAYRCLDYGYKHLVSTKSFVYHKESQSFSESKVKLINEHEEILRQRYPVYKNRTTLWCEQFPLRKVCENIDYQIKLHNRQNILLLIHDWNDVDNNVGGTTLHVYDLVRNLRKYFNFHVLAPSNGIYKLHSYFEDSEKEVKFDFVDSYSMTSKYNAKYKKMIESIVDGFRIDTIHVHHLIGHYMDVVDVAKEKKIKSIITLHDFYSLCPTINMLYMMEKCCIDINNKDKDCKKCLNNKLGINNNIIERWQKDWNLFLAKFDKIIVPSENTKKHINSYMKNLKIDVIEHGVDLVKNEYESDIENTDKINIAFVGVMAKHKGAEILEQLIKNNKNINIHLFGKSEYSSLKKNASNYTYHGPYKRENLPKLLSDNKINLVCSFSIWPETYSYTLQENISSNVPVLSFDLGAVSERIKKYHIGWTLPLGSSADKISKKIDDIFKDKKGYKKVIENIKNYKIKTTEEMASEYKDIYKSKLIKLNDQNAEALRNIIEDNYKVNKSVSSVEAEWIMNSLRWKLVSKIKVPNVVKKGIKKIVGR